jgi:hypothetical protein
MVSVRLIEQASVPGGSRIDRKAGVIHGVKIVGLQSANSAGVLGKEFRGTPGGYSYAPEALKAAIPLYEGARVNLDHPDRVITPDGQKPVERPRVADRFGMLKNVTFKNGAGLYGDLHYLQSHPSANHVTEMAEKMPHTLCLSHNAEGDVKRIDGRVVVTKINKVHSVDLVAGEGGTNSSLFESRNKGGNMEQPSQQPVAAPELSPLESAVLKTIRNSKFDTAKKLQILKHLLNGEAIANGSASDADSDASMTEENDDDSDGDDSGASMTESLRRRSRSGSPLFESSVSGSELAGAVRRSPFGTSLN